ncbi:MAG: putative oxaloacetate decarboxylase gamma chain [Proteobacteria bacterium]|nr:putative oxaloacetate decarboxylase gamma chain [Pseudomonadota bacterium]
MESSIGELILSGCKLMLIGMSIVFLFLALLVWIIGVTSRLINRYSPESAGQVPYPGSAHAVGQEPESEAELVAAISAAIHSYQNP